MNRTRFRWLAMWVAMCTILPAQAQEDPIAGYSTAPLGAPLFNEAQVAVEATAINNWLIENLPKLVSEQKVKPREHLYYLIDSRVKQLYAREQRVLPAQHDLLLEMLFSWAEALDVYGGGLAFNAVKAPSSAAQAPMLKMPEALSLDLAGDLFTMRSSSGWSVSFPYYFMIGTAADFTANDGSRNQFLIVSTGAAKDAGKLGRSQATLMLMFSPDGYESFEKFWSEQFGIGSDVEPKALGVRDLSSRHVLDGTVKLHKEFTSWSNSTGSFAVAYLGNEGTYQWNRVHFIDFVRAILTDDPVESPVRP